MAPPVWTLVLLLGAAWGQGHVPAPVRTQQPLDWKPVARSSRDNSILTQCDFEDDSKPFCNWSQVSADDGDWIRASGPSPTGTTGPPGGYPNGEGYYLHMVSRTFPRGGVARLRSPDLWEQGPFCVHFAYYIFGLSWGAQLRLLLFTGTRDHRPHVLWRHMNTQSPSWMPTAVTVPAELTLPSWLMFEGVRGSTAYLDISLDNLSIRRGTCNRICMMQTCNFDTRNDLCGWSWIPTSSGAKWTQKKGSSGKPGVGPDDDFSSPGNGFYMLLDPKNAKPGQKSVLLSPLSQSTGCLTLSFHYTLRGHSPDAALLVSATVLGSIRKHTLFSGQPGANWQPVSVNYTGQGQIQFTVVGVFGKIPEPAVAVDEISIAPCEESFPQCDFEDSAYPFCDWSHALGDGGRWTWGSKSVPIPITGSAGNSLYGGEHYIYFEADKFSQPGQSVRLVSRPFCAPGDICVAFTYHMYGLGKGATLKILLGTPAGSSPISLWNRVGSQSPDWLNTSITIPSGHQQPMQLIFEAVRGSNTAFVIALGFISISHGACRALVPTVLSTRSPVPTTGPSETTVLTKNPTVLTKGTMVSTEKPTVPTEKSTVPTEKPTIPTEKPTVPTEKSTVPTGKPTVPTEKSTVPTEKFTVLTGKPTVPTEKSTVPTGKPTIPTENPTIPTEETTVPTEKSTVPTGKPTVPTEKPTILTEETTIPTEETTVPTEEPTVPTEKPTIPTEEPNVPTEESTVPPEEPTVPTEETIVPTEKTTTPTEETTVPTKETTIPTEKPTVPTEKSTVPTEKSTVPTGKPTVPTQKPTIPTEETTVPTEKSTVPTEKPTIPTEETTVPPEETTVPTEESTVPMEETTVPTEETTVPTEETTVPTEETTVPTEETTVPTEETTVPTEETTVPTEETTVPTEETTVPTEETTVPTEEITVSTEETTIPTEETTIPTEETTVPPEETTVPTEEPTVPTEETTVPTEETTVPTEETTVPTEEPTVPTEGTTVPTEGTTIPTEETTVSTEEPTVPTEEPTVPPEEPTVPTEETTVPTKKTTIPTEKPTVPTEKSTVPTEKSTVPTEKSTVPTGCTVTCSSLTHLPTKTTASMTSLATTTTTPRPTTVSCPPNAHFESCACPSSCENPKPSCGLLCKPGCVCNPGFLFSNNQCINASSCNCFYSNNYYKPGEEWFSPNCTERCRCWPGSQIECQLSQCATHTVCQLKNGQYECHPYGTATCFVYGDPHYVTFDERHIAFAGKCTYILVQASDNSTESFFRVSAKNEQWGPEGTSCLSKVYVTLPEITITLLKGRRVLIGGQRVTLPVMPSQGVSLGPSGRFVELKTEFGLHVRWDGDQQLFVTVSSTHAGKVCGFCGNYDGDSSNDNLKPDGKPAQNEKELGDSWQMAQDEDKECQKKQTSPASCDSTLQSILSGSSHCGRLMDTHGAFEACLLHLKASAFFDNCMFDMCNFEGFQGMMCAHLSAMTTVCQLAGYPVKPWREPRFCPLTCPRYSRYSMCAELCPETCHLGFSVQNCPDQCVEGCECNPGFVLSGLECVPQSQCGCIDSFGNYFKIDEQWYKPGCKELCICESNNRIFCQPWECGAQESCGLKDGIYGCHSLDTATCTVSGDPHYLTFDGALHHFMGTCTYILCQPCVASAQESFVVSATNEIRGGNLEVSYVKAVHVRVFDFRISLIKGRKVTLNGRRVVLPVWPGQGRVTVRLSGSFILLYTNFGLQVRYDGDHLVEVTVPSSYASQLCGLCGNYNNNSLDDNLRPDRTPASSSLELGMDWRVPDDSDPDCFLLGVNPYSCQENDMTDTWHENCEILMSPLGPFSQCHQVVPPHTSFTSCVHGQCRSKGDRLALCRSLQTYAFLCAQAGWAPAWRNSSFCPLRCPPGSRYNHCANPCPATCFGLNTPKDCPAELPCTEGCECQEGYLLSGTSCVPFSQCGCTDSRGSYHPVGESWYTKYTCSTQCTCSVHNSITCHHATCKSKHVCRSLDGLLRCRASGVGVCKVSRDSQYVSFDGTGHPLQDSCTYVLVKVCHPTSNLPFFKISAKNEKNSTGGTTAFYLHQVYIEIFGSQITMQKGRRVLVNGTQVTLPTLPGMPGVNFTSSPTYATVSFQTGVHIKFDGNHYLEIEVSTAYSGKVCGVCGNFNSEEEDELMMPNDQPALNDQEFLNSWKDRDINQICKMKEDQKVKEDRMIQVEQQEIIRCSLSDQQRAWESCRNALQAPAWAHCASRVDSEPFLRVCTNDFCEFGDINTSLCKALQAFGAACQRQGLKPPHWRNSILCPQECQAHSSYTNCLPSCLPSCLNLDGGCQGAKVPSTCTGGCVCEPGYVLNEDKCVPRSKCSCKDAQGGTIPLGKTWLSSGCTQSCSCTGGRIQCQDFRCPARSHCQHDEKGNSHCAPDKTAQCTVLGDPYYRTFDDFHFRFSGRMKYILVKTVDRLPAGVERLVVEGRNKLVKPESSVLHEVTITIYDYKIQLQENLVLLVNNQKMAIPYSPNEHMMISMQSQQLHLVTDFEMIISFGGKNYGAITLPSTYQELVLGLCGNYDNNEKNDLILPDGMPTTSLLIFVNSWEVNGEDSLFRFRRALPEKEERKEEESGSFGPQCSPEKLALINSTQACSVLVDPQGPFAACHQTMAPEPFQEYCMSDLCIGDPKEEEELRCRVLSGYATICQEAGASLANWRDYTRCAMVCPPNTVYQSCMTRCPASCANPTAPEECEGPCVEGCATLPGYIYSDTQSLPLAECGCTVDGVYYQLGDSFVTEECSQRCTCARSGTLLCEPFSCKAGETCTLGNFTRGCFRESPCLQNPCQNDGRCHEQGASFTCECDFGYGGDICTEPLDVSPPKKPEASYVTAILLGMLVSLVVIVPVVTRECVHRTRRRSKRRREKMQSQNRDPQETQDNNPAARTTLAVGVESASDAGFLDFSSDIVPEPAFKATQF